MNKEIKTDLYELLDVIEAAETYGYMDGVLLAYFGDIIKTLTEEEIDTYIKEKYPDSKYYDYENSTYGDTGFMEIDEEDYNLKDIKDTLMDFKYDYINTYERRNAAREQK